MAYTPSQEILERYADVMVNFALGNGKGIKKGEVVWLRMNETAKPLYLEIYKAIIKAGGHVISNYTPSSEVGRSPSRDFYELAKPFQLSFFADKYMKGLIDQIDHMLYIESTNNTRALEGIDPKKMMMVGEAAKPMMEWRRKKENAGKFSWTIGLYGTAAMAKEAGLSEKAYWEQIIEACFLNEQNPVAKWKNVSNDIKKYVRKLSALKIETVHMTGPDVDLTLKIGKDRRWLGGIGANIPSFEIFTSPDWRGTNGWIKINQPLYRYGSLIKGIRLEFKDGVVVKATATQNEKLLLEMIATPNANKLGEFSLTDKHHSRITKFMADTLYDENIGGPHGNSHVALGSSYDDTYTGDLTSLTPEKKIKLGYNESSVHTDVITTAPRTVTATLANGKEKIIYKDGMFVL